MNKQRKERNRKTQKKAGLRHTERYFNKVEKWRKEFTTDKAPEIFQIMDGDKGNLTKALNRLKNNVETGIPLDLVRDFTIIIYDYYEKRSRWSEWTELGQLGLEVCKELNDSYSLGVAYPSLCTCLGITQRMLGDRKKAMFFYQKAVEQANRHEEKTDVLTSMCDIYRLNGEIEQALKCAKQAITLAKKIHDKDREAKALEYMGLAYVGDKSYDQGINCYKEALALREQTGHLPRQAMVLSYLSYALANSSYEEQNLNQAIEYYKKALEIEIKLDNYQSIGRLKGDIATAYNKLGKYEDAKELSEDAFDYNDRIKFRRGATLNQARLVRSYIGLKDFDKAFYSADYVCEHRKDLTAFDINNLHGFSEMLIILAQYLQGKGNTEKAKEYALIAIEFATTAEESDSLQAAQQFLQDVI